MVGRTRCTGPCKALVIPHNPNFAWGLMFGDTRSDATASDAASRALRVKYDRLVEVFQAKGSSECARGVGSTDEECGFENMFPACKDGEDAINPKTGQHQPRCIASNDMVRVGDWIELPPHAADGEVVEITALTSVANTYFQIGAPRLAYAGVSGKF